MVMEDSVEEIFGISETDSMRHSKVWVCRKEKESGMSPMFWFGKFYCFTFKFTNLFCNV